MKDRVPTKPNQVLITPEGGGTPFYATMTRADEPVELGTPLNKATFLSDSTADILGITSSDPKPDEALLQLRMISAGRPSTFQLFITGQLRAGIC